jgi:hypothetical protein
MKKYFFVLPALLFFLIFGSSSLASGTWTNGEINTYTLSYGGTNYVADETVYCQGGASFYVNTVDEFGSITELTILLIGTNYQPNQIFGLIGNSNNAIITINSVINYDYYPPSVLMGDITEITQTSFIASAILTPNSCGEQNFFAVNGFSIMEGNTGEPSVKEQDITSFSELEYSKLINGLLPNTSYRLRAFAICNYGYSIQDYSYGYSETITITTLSEPITTCSSFNYTNWDYCDYGDTTQERTIINALPQNCEGGNPILIQPCSFSYTASSSLIAMSSEIISQSTDLTINVFTTYWPYILVIIIIAGFLSFIDIKRNKF